MNGSSTWRHVCLFLFLWRTLVCHCFWSKLTASMIFHTLILCCSLCVWTECAFKWSSLGLWFEPLLSIEHLFLTGISGLKVLAFLIIVEVAREFVSPRLQQLIFGVIALLKFNWHISLILFGALLFYILFLKIPKLRNEILYLCSLNNGRPKIFQIFSLFPKIILKYSPLRKIMVV